MSFHCSFFFMQQALIKHLLHVNHSPRWRFNKDQNRQKNSSLTEFTVQNHLMFSGRNKNCLRGGGLANLETAVSSYSLLYRWKNLLFLFIMLLFFTFYLLFFLYKAFLSSSTKQTPSWVSSLHVPYRLWLLFTSQSPHYTDFFSLEGRQFIWLIMPSTVVQ